MKWNFNLSYSTYSTYKKSQLQFYFEKIIKAQPDTKTYQVYGNLGSIVHKIQEIYIDNKYSGMIDFSDKFNDLWFNTYKIPTLRTINNHTVNKDEWFNHVNITLTFTQNFIVERFTKIKSEKYLKFIDEDGLLVKGYIDVFCEDENGNLYLFDYKTDTKYDYDKHKLQRLFYSWLCYKIYGVIPSECTWFYCKGSKSHKDSFTLDDVLKFDEEIKQFKKDIIQKGNNINNYDIGDFDNPFNMHLKKCTAEKIRRENYNNINITIKNNYLIFENELPDDLKNLLRKKYSYFVEGHQWSDKFQKGVWDGKKYLFKNNKLPLGFINNFKRFIEDYNKNFNKNIKLVFNDERLKISCFSTTFKESEKTLRPYQEDSVNKILNKKILIVNLATGLGKTLVATEAVKKINKRTLFVVNRIELADQTKEVFERELGVEIGMITEGNLDTSKQFTVCSIQTIQSILKNRVEDKKKLRNFLFNVSCVIYDECHGVSESDSYVILRKLLLNVEYVIGLTATPFRTDKATLEMNAFVGFPEVVYDTKYGEENGYLCPTKTKFIKNDMEDNGKQDYNVMYDELIVYNEKRNNIIKEIVDKFEGKKVLIITKAIEHAYTLQCLIPNSMVINSKVQSKLRKKNMKTFKEMEGGVLIAGIKIVGQGVDVENLDCIIIASAHKSSVDSVQTIGRVKRIFPGKEFGYLYDFWDSGYFNKSAKERKTILEAQGNKVEIVDNI